MHGNSMCMVQQGGMGGGAEMILCTTARSFVNLILSYLLAIIPMSSLIDHQERLDISHLPSAPGKTGPPSC